ncbi:hypothetical protein [Pengzhenrongella sicca]|uniref:Ig-like domain-containing protein n=1 Tax=Pengzhenrongella sicca TaxID=2819238 RepID=A0A8A4ZEK1_9MICO|nr:hypothetical protein [Pengzhenrongella sicca]QTE28976.1 hypothetical protein J4E96_16935 [Pengzhenrongella sicca]
MRHLGRTLAALLLGALSIFVAGLPASAATTECQQPTPGYAGSGVCAVTVTQAKAACLNNVITLTYAVTTEPDDAATVDLTWVNPAGPTASVTGRPLSGSVAWPSSVPKVAMDIQVAAGGATATVRVDPTAASATCNASGVLNVSDPTSSNRVLSATGAEVLPFAVTGGGLLLVGIALLVVRAARLRAAGEGSEQ